MIYRSLYQTIANPHNIQNNTAKDLTKSANETFNSLKKEEGKSVISTNSYTSTPASLTCVALGSCDFSRHTAIITCGADADFSILLRHRIIVIPLLRRDDTSATNLLSRCRDVCPHSILRRTTWALLLRCKC